MINIIRETQIPKSLTKPEIQKFINDTINYLNNPENHIKPKSNASYRNPDLLEAFDRNFYAKCYLTEQKFANSWAMDIEHFIPKAERPDLTYIWTNLYPADHQANILKPKKTPQGGYLDPCNPKDDVENDIIYNLGFYGNNPKFIAKDSQNIKAKNTVDLLNRIHNGHDEDTRKATLHLRQIIQKRYKEILEKIDQWKVAIEGSKEKAQLTRLIKGLLSRKASFTMLYRSTPVVKQLPNEFFD